MVNPASNSRDRSLVPEATVLDTVRANAIVKLPLIARGVIIRRPRVVGMSERLDADTRAVRLMQQLRNRYGPGPLKLRTPIRPIALVLDPDHVHRVLQESPEPFAVASALKQEALEHFQPYGVLISHGPERQERRRFNEEVLDNPQPLHRFADSLVPKVREEADRLLADVTRSGRLVWEDYSRTWWRVVRRVVLGDAAHDDTELTDMLNRLRANANWAFLRPVNSDLRQQFERKLIGYMERAEPGSLANLVATVPATERVVRHQQMPQWLFAFDAAAWASYRALALIDAHPDHVNRVRDETSDWDGTAPRILPSLRTAVLESLRLWPTTPGIFRDTTEDTKWETGILPAKTTVLIYAPFFHRDETRLPHAHRFTPELWLKERGPQDWPLVPFSGGPGECPGRNLVLMVTSSMLGSLLQRHQLQLRPRTRLDGRHPMPGTLDPFSLRFEVSSR